MYGVTMKKIRKVLVIADNSLLNDMFEVIQASWVIAVGYVFKKFP